MRSHGVDCTCWQVQTEAGETVTAARVSMHERIAVTTRTGQRVEGRPDGPVWFGERPPRRPGYAVETDDGSVFTVPLSEVDSITPLDAPDPVEIIEFLLKLVVVVKNFSSFRLRCVPFILVVEPVLQVWSESSCGFST